MLKRILAADIGSTTTKTVLFEKQEESWRLVAKTLAPTTVEAPNLDVMIGLREALSRLEQRTGIELLSGSRLLTPVSGNAGVDVFVVTSSAGGGLQMVVTGLMKEITAESANRAALGAGAVVSDVIALDDSRSVIERLEAVKRIRPDMVLITGGTDGGNISEVAAVAEMVAMANPEPRFGHDFKIPVVFAGNVEARAYVEKIFEGNMDITYADNIRPVLEKEVLGPARDEIHNLFLEHVMMHAPGYPGIVSWAEGHVMPTPVAVGNALMHLGQMVGGNVLAVDIGGATTDLFSIIDGQFYRTVSANLGMSYSMGNVMAEAGPEFVMRWFPGKLDEDNVRNWNFNKMIRPTGLPQTFEELMLEQAICKEALRLSLSHHKSLVRGLKGVQQRRSAGDIFYQDSTGKTLVDMMKARALVGTGGALSYAPRPNQAAMILLDGLLPEGVTDLFVDSQFLLPHIGVLMDVSKDTAAEIMMNEALVPLGTCIAPAGPEIPPGTAISQVKAGNNRYEVIAGEIQAISMESEENMFFEATPRREFDLGLGPGKTVEGKIISGVTGLILDGRGRPLVLPGDERARRACLVRWYKALDVYPGEILDQCMRG